MGRTAPKPEQLHNNLTRKSGLTLLEMLIALSIAAVALLMITIVTSSTFRITGQMSTILELDEQMSKLNVNMRYLITRKWTAFVPEQSSQSTISLTSEFPGIGSTVTATITQVNDTLVFLFPVDESGSIGQMQIAHFVTSALFEPMEKYLYYHIEFEKNGIQRDAAGAVRFN